MSKKSKKQYSHVKAQFFDSTNQTFRQEQVIDILADQIETENGIYPVEDSFRFFEENSGQIFYMYNVDLPAKVEASKLKTLRRSNALARIFDYDVSKPKDFIRFMPWIAIILLIVFK